MMVQGVCAGCKDRYRRYGVDEWLRRDEDNYCTDECHDNSIKEIKKMIKVETDNRVVTFNDNQSYKIDDNGILFIIKKNGSVEAIFKAFKHAYIGDE